MILNAAHLDILRECINIGVGRAAGSLNQMTHTHVNLSAPDVQVQSIDEFMDGTLFNINGKVIAIRLAFRGLFSGLSALIFPPTSALELVTVLLGQPPESEEMDILRLGTLQEMGNIVLNGVMGSMANMLGDHIDYLPPEYYEMPLGDLLSSQSGGAVLVAHTRFSLEGRVIEGDIVIIFEQDSFGALLESIDKLLAAMA